MDRPNHRRRQLGRTLRKLREQAGLGQEDAGRPLRFSSSKMSRIEQGHIPGYNDFLALLDRYGVITSDYDEYIRMFDYAKERGWWHAFGQPNTRWWATGPRPRSPCASGVSAGSRKCHRLLCTKSSMKAPCCGAIAGARSWSTSSPLVDSRMSLCR